MSGASPGPLTDDELTTAARAEAVAQRTPEEVERAAQRFVTSTRERAVRKTQAERSRPRRVVAMTAAASVAGAVVGAVAVIVLVGAHAKPASEGASTNIDVKPAPGAVLDRIDRGPVHAARLYEGTLMIACAQLPRGERFLVVTGDAELEGDGALFETTVRGDRLQRVRVVDGRVHVRPIDGAPRDVGAGETLDVPPSALPSVEAVRARMNEGLDKLAAGDLDTAAARFEAEAAIPGSPFLEDATFWEAVALSRGHKPTAIAKIQSFLARFPASAHRAEAEGVLGWQLLDGGDVDAARAAFDDAFNNGDARVRESAQAGIAKLGATAR